MENKVIIQNQKISTVIKFIQFFAQCDNSFYTKNIIYKKTVVIKLSLLILNIITYEKSNI